MGNAESVTNPPIQQVHTTNQPQPRPIQRQPVQRQPVQQRMQTNTQRTQQVRNNPQPRNTQNNAIQQQLRNQQQQIEAQRRHQQRLEDQLNLQETNNKMFQDYIENQVQSNMHKQRKITNSSKNNEYRSSLPPPLPQQQYLKEEESCEEYDEEPSTDAQYDPYEILGIAKGCNIEKIKKAYKKRALQYHPDRGGNPAIFKIIEKSYRTLLNQYNEDHQYDNKINQEVRNVHYDANINNGMQNRHVDKDNFDINKFNTVFSKYKLEDANDTGYGNMMNNTPENIEVDKTQNNKDNFNVNNFNNNFNKVKQTKRTDKIIEYKEPEALISGDSLSFSELGQTKIDDFSSSHNNLQFTDYKKAHVTDTTLIDPNKVKYKKYRNMNEIQKDRSNISYTMNKEDNTYHQKKKEEDDYKERERQSYIRDRDNIIQTRYQTINTNMISH
jgi:hypothetical protein